MENASGTSNDSRGTINGGSTGTRLNKIQYITCSTTGNATDFGDLLDVITSTAAAAGDA